MNKFRNSVYLLIVALTIFGTAKSQADEFIFLKNAFNAVITRDSTKFFQHCISKQELNDILTVSQRLEMEKLGIQDSSSTNRVTTPYNLHSVLFRSLLNNIDSISGKGTALEFVNAEYQVVKSSSIIYPSLKGMLYFKGSGKLHQLPVEEAIFINGRWKIASLGDVNILKGTQLANKESMKVSAFGFLKTVTVTELTIEDFELEEPPPPPPPPKPGNKKNQD